MYFLLIFLHVGHGLIMVVLHASSPWDPGSQSIPYLGYWHSHSREKTDHSVIMLGLWKLLPGSGIVTSTHISLAKASLMATPELNWMGRYNIPSGMGDNKFRQKYNLLNHCTRSNLAPWSKVDHPINGALWSLAIGRFHSNLWCEIGHKNFLLVCIIWYRKVIFSQAYVICKQNHL